MPYQDRAKIFVPAETKEDVRKAKEELDTTYREFFERAIDELTEG